jgi:hypothetical protein
MRWGWAGDKFNGNSEGLELVPERFERGYGSSGDVWRSVRPRPIGPIMGALSKTVSQHFSSAASCSFPRVSSQTAPMRDLAASAAWGKLCADRDGRRRCGCWRWRGPERRKRPASPGCQGRSRRGCGPREDFWGGGDGRMGPAGSRSFATLRMTNRRPK